MDLLKKLHIKPDLPLLIIDLPDEVRQLFAGSAFTEKPGRESPVAQVVLFATKAAELHMHLVQLADVIGQDTLLWIAYPKKSGAIKTDLAHMSQWDQVFALGYRGQASATIDENWTGFRMTKAPARKATLYDRPQEEREVEGIDFVKRTVLLPADALEGVRKHAGMAAFFDKLSFTTKKEYVTGIVTSAKAATRVRRIEKMITDLQERMHAGTGKQQHAN